MIFISLKDASFRKKILVYGIYFSYLIFFIALLGFSPIYIKYYNMLKSFIKYYICLFLIIKFRPYQDNIKFDHIDAHIVFQCGIFLLVSTELIQFLENYVTNKINIKPFNI